jgi:carboxyl-terminal processing protease
MSRLRSAYRLALGLLATVALQPGPARGQTRAPEAAVAAFRRILATRYVTPVDLAGLARAKTMEDLLALVRTDPFTDVYSPDEWRQLSVSLGESFGGIGAVLGTIRDTLVLNDITPNGPAAAAGLHARDRVVTIDDSVIIGWSVVHAVQHIRGSPGSPVTLGVVRGAEPVTQIRIVRASVHSPSIVAASLDSTGLGVIVISQFGPDLSQSLARMIDAMQADGLERLIIDLRRNPGGLLDEAVGVANLFLPQGSLLVETRYRGQQPDRHLAELPSRYPDLPLAVLIGPASASASEIVAGALQDAHRAILVGRQTYGKGLVQSVAPLADGWMAKFTAGRWYTPAGRLIDRGTHASSDSTRPFDPTAPHSGGVLPELVTADSLEDADRRAIDLMDQVGPAIYLALDDEVGRFLAAHPDFDVTIPPLPGSAAHVLTASGPAVDSLGAESRAALTPWLDAEVTRRAIEARFGSGTALIWRNLRDPQIAAAASALVGGGERAMTGAPRRAD